MKHCLISVVSIVSQAGLINDLSGAKLRTPIIDVAVNGDLIAFLAEKASLSVF